MSVSQEKMEKALKYLAETDIDYGTAKGRAEGIKYHLKIAKAQAMVAQIGKDGTVAEKEARAETDEAYKAKVEEYANACLDRDVMGAKRKTAELIIEVWRSVNAGRRQGNVT